MCLKFSFAAINKKKILEDWIQWELCIFIDFAANVKPFSLCSDLSQTVVFSNDIVFYKSEMWYA